MRLLARLAVLGLVLAAGSAVAAPAGLPVEAPLAPSVHCVDGTLDGLRCVVTCLYADPLEGIMCILA